MPNIFDSIKLTKPRTSRFDLSHDVKLSCNMGDLVPIMCTECVPGDRFEIASEALVRFQPLIAPIMHRLDVTLHYFFVPNRLIWQNWEKWITNTKLASAQLPAFPFVTIQADGSNWNADGSTHGIADYLGIPNPLQNFPLGGVTNENVSALPFAAYTKIVNDYYRDQNLQADLIEAVGLNTGYPLQDGDNTTGYESVLGLLRKRAWEHDYFTSALPFAQKGDAVSLPLGEVQLQDNWNANPEFPRFSDSLGATPNGNVENDSGPTEQIQVAGGPTPVAYDPKGSLELAPTTINDLRRAFRLQEWLEKNARGGTRYIENILSHFGVKSSDKRLQRPEYITGTKTPVVISEVLNNTGTTDRPQGDMAGHAIAVANGKKGGYYCEEHGYIIGIMNVQPKTAYQQGIARHFRKITDPTEFYFPSFANLGEQAIDNSEIFAFSGVQGDTFGYIPRYAEYKFENNRVAGNFRDTLNFWHMGRIFETLPALNAAFIQAEVTDRNFAVQIDDEDKILCAVYNKVHATRPMPKFGTPTF